MGFLLLRPLHQKIWLRKADPGLIARVVRISLFTVAAITKWMYYIGILIHLIFGFFYVGGQFNRQKARRSEITGTGFIFLVTFGVGLLSGHLICQIIHHFIQPEERRNSVWGISNVLSIVLLAFF
jgi:hypothetical protein